MKALIESLGNVISESRAKKSRKRRTGKRVSDKNVKMAQQIGSALKSRSSEIEKLLPIPWRFSSPLVLDKSDFKTGDAYMRNEIEADHGYWIAPYEEVAKARFVVGCYLYNDGDGVVCSAYVSDFNPSAEDDGVEVRKMPAGGELEVEEEWKRKKDPFNPSKDLWPLVKKVMKKLDRQMPEYEEVESYPKGGF